MFLRHRLQDSQTMIGIGSLCLATAIVAQRFVHPPGDFGQGLVAGVSGVLLGLSIVLNVRGMMLRRRDGNGRS